MRRNVRVKWAWSAKPAARAMAPMVEVEPAS
jgi:hypothetical protein